MKESALEDIQREITDRILSDPMLSKVGVIMVEKAVIDSDIAELIGVYEGRDGAVGANILVLSPSVDLREQDAPGPQLNLLPAIRVIEAPLLNREEGGTGVTASEMALRLLRLCHQWHSDQLGRMVFADRQAVRPASLPREGEVGYDVYLQIPDGFDGDRVPPVSIRQMAADVTLLCHNAQAEIWYTLNGSYPFKGNEAAIRYTHPFPAPAGQLLRASAYHGEAIPSNVTQQQF